MLPNQIIKITTNELNIQTVSARDLYEFLELKERFSKFTKRMFEFGFIEGVDYTPYQMVHPSNDQVLEDFVLTIDCAKELSMIQRTDKGKEARLYFIECEKKLRQQLPLKQFTTRELLELALKSEDEKEQALIELSQANKTIEIQAPKIEYVNKVLASESTFNTTTIAKELGMSAIDLNRKLKEMHIQYFVDGHWVLTAKYQNLGYAKTRTHTFYNSENVMCTQISMVWSEIGRKFLHDLLNPELKKAG